MKTGTCHIGGPEWVRLTAALRIVTEAFGEPCWLVGSALETRDYRDVDVRVTLNDEAFETLFGASPPPLIPLRLLIGLGISEYLSTATGLRVDFQIQKASDVSDKDRAKRRHLVGMPVNLQKPAWMGEPQRVDADTGGGIYEKDIKE